MRSYPTRLVILTLLLTLLLAACGDATGTVVPAAQPTTTQPITTTIATTQTTTPPAKTSTPSPVLTESISINVGQTFLLKTNQSAILAKTGEVIKFSSISEDSRCPDSDGNKSVACVWAGQVSAVIELNQANNPAVSVKLTLPGANNSANIPASAITKLGNNQLQLLRVEPRMIIDKTINPADYVVTLQITNGSVTPTQSTTTPVTNQQITLAPGQLPTKTSQPTTTQAIPPTTAPSTATPTPRATNIPGTPSDISLDKPFQIKLNQSAAFAENGLVITFSSITEDSRCPRANGNKDVACSWSGQVSAQLQVKQGSNPVETVKLTMFGGTPTKVPDTAIKKLGKYQLMLVTVEPYPIIDISIDPSDYVVTLQLTKI